MIIHLLNRSVQRGTELYHSQYYVISTSSLKSHSCSRYVRGQQFTVQNHIFYLYDIPTRCINGSIIIYDVYYTAGRHWAMAIFSITFYWRSIEVRTYTPCSLYYAYHIRYSTLVPPHAIFPTLEKSLSGVTKYIRAALYTGVIVSLCFVCASINCALSDQSRKIAWRSSANDVYVGTITLDRLSYSCAGRHNRFGFRTGLIERFRSTINYNNI